MKRVLLLISISSMLLSASMFSNFSFAYGGDSDRIDKNFMRDDKREIVLDKKSNKFYYDSTPSAKMDYHSAIEYCNNMDYLGYSDWRVPTKDELKSLLDLARRKITIKHAFQNIQKGIYWSATKDRYEQAWYIDFDLGRYNTAKYDHKYYVICVKKSDIKQ